jgi:hypothetical protein
MTGDPSGPRSAPAFRRITETASAVIAARRPTSFPPFSQVGVNEAFRVAVATGGA